MRTYCAMPICFKINTNVKLLSFVVQMFNTSFSAVDRYLKHIFTKQQQLISKYSLCTYQPHLEPDILEWEVKWALGNIGTELVEVMEFQLSYFKILKDDAVKVLHSIFQQIWKILCTSQ